MSREKSGLFFVISAPSGTGKTTLVRKILNEIPNTVPSISVTTRPPRPGEKEGVDYYFVSQEKFKEMKDRREFFESEEVHGYLYGTPRAALEKAQQNGKIIVLDIDVRGALTFKKNYPESCLVFLSPPSQAVLERRLRSRRTEPEASLKRRLEAAAVEMREKEKFDCVIINDDLENAFRETQKVLEEALRKL